MSTVSLNNTVMPGAPSSAPSPGRSRHGKLRTGVVAGSTGIGSKASIPTRFETILSTEGREANAFGRRTQRFDEPPNVHPGPGAYAYEQAFAKSNVSTSNKGSSGFALAVGLNKMARPTPGPGEYSADISASSPSQRKANAVFCGPSPKPVLHVARPAAAPLGPGQYFTDHIPSTLDAPCGAVMSQAAGKPRTSVYPKAAVLGPGSYNVEAYNGVSVRDPLRPSHFSVSGTSRFQAPKHHDEANRRHLATNLPPLLASSHDVDRLAVPEVVREVRNKHWAQQHDAPRATTVKPSSMFQETNLDRFGNPIVRYTAPRSDNLGPGSYDTEEKPRRMLISSSWALSGTKRDYPKDRYQPPGPAFYAPPSSTTRVSHRVTDQHSFVV